MPRDRRIRLAHDHVFRMFAFFVMSFNIGKQQYRHKIHVFLYQSRLECNKYLTEKQIKLAVNFFYNKFLNVMLRIGLHLNNISNINHCSLHAIIRK